MSDKRLQDLVTFYSLLDELGKKVGGARTLAGCRGRMQWPLRGVYFFHETGENRSDTGEGPRVARVGTHALKEGGSTTLWGRLSADHLMQPKRSRLFLATAFKAYGPRSEEASLFYALNNIPALKTAEIPFTPSFFPLGRLDRPPQILSPLPRPPPGAAVKD